MLTYTQLVAAVADNLGMKKTQVKAILDHTAAVVAANLDETGVTFKGLGKFRTKHVKATTRTLPSGERKKFPARTAVRVTIAKALKEAVA